MPRAFDAAAKGFPRALKNLRSFLQGGTVHDHEALTLVDAGPTEFTYAANQARELRLHALAETTIHDLDIMVSTSVKVGDRLLVVYEAEDFADASATITEGAGVTIQSIPTYGAIAAVASITFDTEGEYALLEYGGADTWNLIYTTGVIA